MNNNNIILKRSIQFNNLEELLDYRAKVEAKAMARTATFNDNMNNYWYYHLKDIDKLFKRVLNELSRR